MGTLDQKWDLDIIQELEELNLTPDEREKFENKLQEEDLLEANKTKFYEIMNKYANGKKWKNRMLMETELKPEIKESELKINRSHLFKSIKSVNEEDSPPK